MSVNSESTTDRPQDIVEAALSAAAAIAAAADSVGTAVIVTEDSTANLRWAVNTLTTNGVGTGQSVTVIATARTTGGTSVGILSRRGITVDTVAALVADAQAAAVTAPPAEDAMPFITGGADGSWDEPAHVTGSTALAGVATGLGEALGSARTAGRELFGFAEHSVSTSWLGTSTGVRRRHVQPHGSVELTGKSHERSRSTWVGQATRDFSDVDIAALDAQLITRLGWQERRIDLEPGRYDTVLPPTSVADLLIYAYWSGDARGAHEGRSVYSARGEAGGTRVGEQLTDVPLTVGSDPAHSGLESAPFMLTSSSSPFASVFDNGMDTPAVTWIDAGRLVALPTSRHTAGLTGLPVRPFVDNLLLDSPDGGGDTMQLASELGRGLLVTSLWYIREVDPTTLLLTGLTRDGVYLVEGGEVVGSVNNFRFNESPVDMLRRVTGIGDSVPAFSREWGEYFPRTQMPALTVSGFNMSSVSKAS